MTADRGVVVGLGGGLHARRYGSTGWRDWTVDLAVQDGSVDAVLAGGSVRGLGFPAILDQATLPLRLLGLTSAGAWDPRVGGSGVLDLSPFHGPHELVADAANRLYVVASTYVDSTTEPAGRSLLISRRSSSGEVDAAYGTAGFTTIAVDDGDPSPNLDGVALAPDGSLFIGGELTRSSGNKVVVVRKIGPTGTPDAGFGTAGAVEVAGRRMVAITVDPAGRPVLSILGQGATPKPEIVRLDAATGALDGSFGVGGIMAVSGLVTDLAVTPDGRLLTVSRVARNGAFVEYVARRTP